MEFEFSQDGSQLPELMIASGPGQPEPELEAQPRPALTPQTAQPEPGAVEKAATLSGGISGFLMTIAGFLPSRLRSPLIRASSQVYQGQVQGRRVQELSNTLRSPGGTPQQQPSGKMTLQDKFSSITERWAETPVIKPGDTLVVDLVVKSIRSGGRTGWPFQLLSRSMEGENSPVVVQEGIVHLPGGFWTHRVYPNLLIIASAFILLIAAAYWTSALPR